MPLEKLYSVEEAAQALGGLSKETIHAWFVKGKLRRCKIGGRTMVRESELQRVIEEGDGGKRPRTNRSVNDKTAPMSAVARQTARKRHKPSAA